jgi:hypothetical protein
MAGDQLETAYDAQLARARTAGLTRDDNPPLGNQLVHFVNAANLDHTVFWRTSDGELISTSDPYHLEAVVLGPLIANCRGANLAVVLSGRSMYSLNTFMIVVARPAIIGRLVVKLDTAAGY